MANTFREEPSNRRVLLRFLWVCGLALFYLWIGIAIYLWLSASHYPSYGELARAFLALRDSLFSLPNLLLYILGHCIELLLNIYSTLIAQLGYDPFAISSIPGMGYGPGAITLNGLKEQILQGLWSVGLGLSLLQFFGLILLNTLGVGIGWTYICIPRLLNTRGHVFFCVAALGTTFWLCASAFETGAFAGISGVLIAALLLWKPFVAGLTLWLLVMFGFSPRTLRSLPFAIASFFGRLMSEGPRPRDASDGIESGFQSDTSGDPAQDDEPGHMPSESDPDKRLASACSTMNLTVEEFVDPDFEKQSLVSLFRTLARKRHPDAQGSEQRMVILNTDYEFLLRHKGWTR